MLAKSQEETMSTDRISVIGLGGMGKAMASRLLDTGYQVTVYNRTAERADDLIARGARFARTPREAVEPGGIVLSSLANDSAVEAVSLGDAGIVGALHGGVHLSTSTISPTFAARLAERHRSAGVEYLGSPVFGRPPAAASGKLWIAISGSAAGKERVRPILAVLGRGIVDFGDKPEAANVVKVAGNFMIASAIETMSEAFALVAKHGIGERQFYDLFSQSLFACRIFQGYGQSIVEREFEPAGFRLELGSKDIGLALQAGGEAKVPMPIASVLRDRFLNALAKGRGESDWSAIALSAFEDAAVR